MMGHEIERLIQILARLPGLGPRSARRVVLHLLKKRDGVFVPLMKSLHDLHDSVKTCSHCGNYDSTDPCAICQDANRDVGILCVVEDVSSLWALERSAMFKGRYHVLGGVLSAIDGIGPNELSLALLLDRLKGGEIEEVILALPATIDGQTTSHYLADLMAGSGIRLSALAHGVPIGSELDYLDDGTLGAALRARRSL